MNTKPTDYCPICSTLEEKITEQILSVVKSKTYSKGVIICDQNEAPCGLHLIQKGSVKVARYTPQGKEIILEIKSAGSTFGEMNLVTTEKTSHQLTAIENTEVFYIPRESFQTILQESPELYVKIFSSLVRWMDKLNSIIETMNNPSAKDRVHTYLKQLVFEQKNNLIHLSGKKHEVALMLGLRPETFSRVLSDLEAHEIIKMNHKQIQILNINAL